ncbi:mannose-1-phosphate guanylyltransferase/mannose-6-phosphate isomerase [Pseudomonas lini]|uniref:mannose-1-phosphate guanylyltransferase/mannose-6-phosphate isomerase n=1 Tax=Pseudomonas lini TaxID=163011 RepID=UPI0005794F61|nr:mannose-1-phosphate guanylyltransferase/mannose-6-phosphate isomerase [Pseudomonas lini]NSX08440.1 mannose-1-phosphate guanylyltransferase/mannose-6-phosphate isomerase [Pseudomonas lini]
MIPVILSGGSGTRLWPLSRALKPKQFISIHGDLSLFQATLDRIKNLSTEGESLSPPIIVCNEDHRFIVAEQSRSLDIKPQKILLEPTARNTAPAIAAATLAALEDGDDPILLVLAADHVISDINAFKASLALARVEVNKGRIVTFGVVPTKPETGYGYIRTQMNTAEGAAHVEAFVEKPDLETAQSYLAQGNYFWNSGMFMFRASVMKSELERLSPDIIVAAELSLSNAAHDHDFTRLNQVDFVNAPNVSIDYAVMEKTNIASVVILNSSWSDLGAWDSVWEAGLKDENENCIQGDVLLQGVTNSYVHSSHRLVTVLGISDVVVVETSDAILVTTKENSQDVKKIVSELTKNNRVESASHREVYRPWGKYDSVDQGHRYQVKRITVKPGHKLSVQLHHHRAEHWIVVSGTANVQIGDKQVLLSENQSTYIPIGVVHSLENPGRIPLELIEVQSGSYLGEDDIVRFEDRYGRLELV